MIFILRPDKIGEPSCSKLKTYLELNGITEVEVGREVVTDSTMRIRWGSRLPYNGYSTQLELNTPEAIGLAVDKKRARKIFRDNGLLTPRSFFSKKEVLISKKVFPIIGRPRVHTQGKHFEVFNSQSEIRNFPEMGYYSELIPKDREIRVYVVGGRVEGIAEKIPEDPSEISWNVHQGAKMMDVAYNIDAHTWAEDNAKFAMKLLGLNFGGVDIMMYKNMPYVLEVNTAPALSNFHRLEIFGKYFLEEYTKLGLTE